MKRSNLIFLLLLIACFSCNGQATTQSATLTKELIIKTSIAALTPGSTLGPSNTVTQSPEPGATSAPLPSIQPSETPSYSTLHAITEANARLVTIVSELKSSAAQSRILELEFGPSGDLIAAANGSGDLVLWRFLCKGTSIAVDNPQLDIIHGNGEAIDAISISPDGTKIASGGLYAPLLIRDLASGKVIKGPTSTLHPGETLYFQNGSVLAVAGYDFDGPEHYNIELWDVSSNQLIAVLNDYPTWYGPICSLAVNHDESILAAGFCDYQMMIWDVKKEYKSLGKVLGMYSFICLSHCPFPTNEIAFQPNNNILASGTDNPKIPLRNVDTGRLELIISTVRNVEFQDSDSGEWSFSNEIPDVRDIAFNTDGTVLAIAAWSEVQLRSAKTGELLAFFEIPQDNYVTSVSFSPDGLLIAVGTEQGDIHILGIRE